MIVSLTWLPYICWTILSVALLRGLPASYHTSFQQTLVSQYLRWSPKAISSADSIWFWCAPTHLFFADSPPILFGSFISPLIILFIGPLAPLALFEASSFELSAFCPLQRYYQHPPLCSPSASRDLQPLPFHLGLYLIGSLNSRVTLVDVCGLTGWDTGETQNDLMNFSFQVEGETHSCI